MTGGELFRFDDSGECPAIQLYTLTDRPVFGSV